MTEKRSNRFDYSSAAVGAVIAIGLMVSFLAATEISPFGSDNFCEVGETPLICARNWTSFLAVAIGAVTIFLLARAQIQEARQFAIQRHIDSREHIAAHRRVLKFLIPAVQNQWNAAKGTLRMEPRDGSDRKDTWAESVRFYSNNVARLIEHPDIQLILRTDEGNISYTVYFLQNLLKVPKELIRGPIITSQGKAVQDQIDELRVGIEAQLNRLEEEVIGLSPSTR